MPEAGRTPERKAWLPSPLGLTEAQFSRMHNRLLQLDKCSLTHEPVPKQRKPYKKRVKAETVLSFATAACTEH
jgi:hypothetical protein